MNKDIMKDIILYCVTLKLKKITSLIYIRNSCRAKAEIEFD